MGINRLAVDILGVSEVRQPNGRDFWSGQYRILYSDIIKMVKKRRKYTILGDQFG